jgi:hypothetical protein
MDALLSFNPFLTFVVIVIACGSMIGAIAQKKHRNPWLWKATGAFGFLVALVAILRFKDLDSLSPDEKKRSHLKEQILFVLVILAWVAGISMYFQGGNEVQPHPEQQGLTLEKNSAPNQDDNAAPKKGSLNPL